jgi:hypothetical protein
MNRAPAAPATAASSTATLAPLSSSARMVTNPVLPPMIAHRRSPFRQERLRSVITVAISLARGESGNRKIIRSPQSSRASLILVELGQSFTYSVTYKGKLILPLLEQIYLVLTKTS